MDLDYSKLSTKELEAIANNDYSKLSTRTLEALAKPAPQDKSAWEKFSEPLANMSWEDWRKKSIASPTLDLLQSILPGGTEEQYQQASARVREKGNEIVGGLANIVQNPVESAQKAYEAVTTNPAGVAGEMVKGAIYDPNLALMPGTGDMAMAAGRGAVRGAEAVGRGAEAVGRGAKAVAQTGLDVGKGALGRATGYIAKPGEVPSGYQVPSSRIPLSNEFTTPEDWARFQRGELPYGEFPPTTPIEQLPKTTLEKAALMASGGEIPAQGQAARAFGERIGETYRNPITAAIDIGSMFTTGVPIMTAARTGLAGVQGAADWMLAKKGFDPSLPEKMAAYKSGQMPMPGTPPTAGPVVPQQFPLTVQGPGQTLPPSVIPMGTQPRAVNIEGQRSVLPYQINTQNSQAARPSVGPISPKEISQQVAASKIQQPVQQTPVQPIAPAGAPQLPSTRWSPEEQLKVKQSMEAPLPVTQPTPQPVLPTESAIKIPKLEKKGRLAGEIRRELDPLHNELDRLSDELKSAYATDKPALRAETDKLREQIAPLQKEFDLAMANEQGKGKRAKFDSLKKPVIKADTDLGKFLKDADLTHTSESREFMYGTLGDKEIAIRPPETTQGMIEIYDITGKTPVKIHEFQSDGSLPSPKKKGPDVSQMLTEDTIFNTKSEWEKANSFNTLAEKKRVGGYKEGDYIVREELNDYSSVPEGLRKELPERSIVKRTLKGKRVE